MKKGKDSHWNMKIYWFIDNWERWKWLMAEEEGAKTINTAGQYYNVNVFLQLFHQPKRNSKITHNRYNFLSQLLTLWCTPINLSLCNNMLITHYNPWMDNRPKQWKKQKCILIGQMFVLTMGKKKPNKYI